MKNEIIIIAALVFLFIAAIIWLDRRNQRRFDQSKALYGGDSEEWRLNGVRVSSQMIYEMLGRCGVQMQQSVETEENGKIIHKFMTVCAKDLPNM